MALSRTRRISKILEGLKEDIKPDNTLDRKISLEVDRINALLKAKGIKAAAVLGGSFAKGTYLKKDFDVDVFVRFDYSYEEDDISGILEDAIRPLNASKVHGSRDYFQIKGKPSFEIIPVLDVMDPKQAKNVTDMSPLHVRWVNENIKGNQREDIKIAKLFCKANNVYGAESYIQGFSGHVIDILIIHYGSFLKLLEAACIWKEPEVIDMYDIYKGNALKRMNISKLQSPLILVDPLSPERNAAAALGKEKFMAFRDASKRFLEDPRPSAFRKQEVTLKKLMRLRGKNKLIFFEAEVPEGKTDVVGSKLLKAYSYILNKFMNNTFTVLSSGWEWDKKNKAFFWYIAKNEFLEKSFMRVGPPLGEKYHVELFKGKHKKTEIKEGRIYAPVKREYRKIEKLALALTNEKVVLERVSRIRVRTYR